MTVRFKTDSHRTWRRSNPILAEGEPGRERETGKLKVGDGVTRWNALPYFSSGGSGGSVTLDADLTAFAALDTTTPGTVATDGSGWVRKTYAQFKSALGLGDVDNTADVDKPVSFAAAFLYGGPGLNPNTAVPQTLVLNTVFTYDEMSNFNNGWYVTGALTITANTNRALPRGQVGWVVGTMSDGGEDGVYVITDMGSGATPWVLTRHSDYDTAATAIRNMVFKVADGGFYTLSVDLYDTPTIGNEGYFTNAVTETTYSHAEGSFSHAKGLYSHAEGDLTLSQGNYSHAEGDFTHAEGTSAHAEGSSTRAEGHYSHAEGVFTHAQGFSSHAEGYGAYAEGWGAHARAGGLFGVKGTAQYVSLELSKETTDATPTSLTDPGATHEIIVRNDRVVGLRAMVSARKTDGTLGKAWTVTAAARCDAVGAVTILGTPTVTVLGEDAGASAWSLALSTGANALRLLVTGAAGTTIHWSATAETKEVK